MPRRARSCTSRVLPAPDGLKLHLRLAEKPHHSIARALRELAVGVEKVEVANAVLLGVCRVRQEPPPRLHLDDANHRQRGSARTTQALGELRRFERAE